MKLFGYSILFLLICFLFVKNVFAIPKISILNSPAQINKNEEFTVIFNVINDLLSSDSYYIKGRIGSSSASMNQGETYNSLSNNWLSDTASWSTFPTIAFSNSSIATSSVTLRIKSTALTENNVLAIRLNRNSTSYDSLSNIVFVLDPLPTITPTLFLSPTISPTEMPIPTLTSYHNIYISEAMVNPAKDENEWIELFNNNDYAVSLMNWFIDDIENSGSSPKMFSLEIPSKSYGVFMLSSSMFNNTGDSVRLLDFNKNLKDSFEYSSSTQGKTYGRISLDSDDFCLQEPSKGNVNNPCINPTPSSTPKPSNTLTPSKTSTYLSVTAVLNRSTNQLARRNLDEGGVINTNNGEVLGIANYNDHNNTHRFIRSLSFISFSYSLLTILSIFLKMKNTYEKGL